MMAGRPRGLGDHEGRPYTPYPERIHQPRGAVIFVDPSGAVILVARRIKNGVAVALKQYGKEEITLYAGMVFRHTRHRFQSEFAGEVNVGRVQNPSDVFQSAFAGEWLEATL